MGLIHGGTLSGIGLSAASPPCEAQAVRAARMAAAAKVRIGFMFFLDKRSSETFQTTLLLVISNLFYQIFVTAVVGYVGVACFFQLGERGFGTAAAAAVEVDGRVLSGLTLLMRSTIWSCGMLTAPCRWPDLNSSSERTSIHTPFALAGCALAALATGAAKDTAAGRTSAAAVSAAVSNFSWSFLQTVEQKYQSKRFGGKSNARQQKGRLKRELFSDDPLRQNQRCASTASKARRA